MRETTLGQDTHNPCCKDYLTRAFRSSKTPLLAQISTHDACETSHGPSTAVSKRKKPSCTPPKIRRGVTRTANGTAR